jgi:DNA-binding transcriptional LysR family regulator
MSTAYGVGPMRYTLAQLEAFLWVARLGGFGPAARHLSLTQPTISLRIREMENSLGVRLFDRTGYRPVLSAAGATILNRAESLLALAEEIETDLRQSDPLHGLLRIGATDVFAMIHLSELLSLLESEHPKLRVQVTVDFSTRLERKLDEGEVDIAIMTRPHASASYFVQPLADVELAWFAAADSRFDRGELTPADLVDAQIISNPPPSHLHTTILEWFRCADRMPARISTCNPLLVMARLVASNFGVALLPTALLRVEPCSRPIRAQASSPVIPPHEMCIVAKDPATPGLRAVAKGAHQAVVRGGVLRPARAAEAVF